MPTTAWQRDTWTVAAVAALAGATGCGGPSTEETSARGGDTATLAGRLPDRHVSVAAPGDGSRGPARDWTGIRARDTLVVAAASNSTTYFVYKGEPLGYEYELLKEFAADHGLALRLHVAQHRDSLLAMLADGRADVAAARLIPAPADSGRIAFTHALYRTEPVLVQQKATAAVAAARLPDPADTMLKRGPAERAPRPVSTATLRARLVQHPAELAGRRVTLPRRSPFGQTLLELADSITGDIAVVEIDASPETVMREVAKGNVAYTVAEADLAKLQGSQYANLVIRPVMGEPKKVAWALRRDAPMLRDTLDAWIASAKTGARFPALYRKYYIDARAYGTRSASRYLTSQTGTLCAYDTLLKTFAPRLGWDWRLLGSQMYQESRFDPNARSWVGARGLMQLMPGTAKQMGVRATASPRENLEGGVRYLEWLQKYWRNRIVDEDERLRFVLASYNAGAGHVEDAQRLAEKKGDDPQKWEDVAYWLLQLSKAEHYGDPVVRYGYVRGLEPVTYVSVILDRYDHYRQFVVPAGRAKADE
jgi:membrane-bound lytic murein transglycosylase F